LGEVDIQLIDWCRLLGRTTEINLPQCISSRLLKVFGNLFVVLTRSFLLFRKLLSQIWSIRHLFFVGKERLDSVVLHLCPRSRLHFFLLPFLFSHLQS
jgi:hypothetical protein